MMNNSFISVNRNSNQPVFAILTDIVHKNDSFTFHSIQTFCEEVALYCEKCGIFFYVFSIQTLQNNELFGYIFSENKWVKAMVPLPDIVHNRIHSRKSEKSNEFQQLTYLLHSFKIPHFNDHFINKWETYSILKAELQIRPYLPETHLLISKKELENFLLKFNRVFIKPIHGSQGKKIIRITTKDKDYYLDYTTFSSDIEHCFSSYPLLFQTLRTRLSKEAFIIQQGIAFINFQQKEVDFRVLCHKNQSGNWTVTSLVARVSNKESFVANIARGGEIHKPIAVLIETFDHSTTQHIIKLLKELAIEICTIISEAIEGYYGEFGIDLGVDIDGNPWIIEVNTKPSKNLDINQDSVKIRPSAKAIVHYARFLIEK